MTCQHCKHWKPTHYNGDGHCGRHAPVLVVVPGGQHTAQYEITKWPRVSADEYCGDFDKARPVPHEIAYYNPPCQPWWKFW